MVTSLSGADWRFRADPHGLGELFAEDLNRTHSGDARWMEPDHDDRGWDSITVPAAWQSEGYDHNGTAWYRRRFDAPSPGGRRTFINFAAVDYFADVWLNGACLGSHEGHCTPFSFEITDLLRPAGNTLALRVDSPRFAPGELNELGQLKTIFKGILERADTNDPELVPGGITGDASLRTTGPVAIAGLRVRAVPHGGGELGARAAAAIDVEVTLSGPPGVAAALALAISDGDSTWHEATQTFVCVGGPQRVRFQVDADNVALWWTWDLGEPALHTALVSTHVNGHESDARRQRFGIRRVTRGNGWQVYVNGVRFFQRGADYVCDQLQHLATRQRYARDVALMREANLNTAHPFCNVERDEFYDACDENGILVYQDFPAWMAVSDDSEVVRRALRVHAEIVDHLGGHPSVAVWNCGSQATFANAKKLCSALARQARGLDPDRIVSLTNAVFATGDLDTHPGRSFFWTQERARELAAELDWRWDTHQYHGWYWGEMTDVRDLPDEELELITEFGAQGLPRPETLREIIPPGALWPPDWDAWARRCMQPELQLARVAAGETLESFVEASQRYQALVVSTHVEHYRRRRFRPCNGAHVFLFADFWPAITWAVLEYDRTPKQAFFALKRSMAPLQAFLLLADPLVADVPARAELTVVNDLRVGFEAARVRVSSDGRDLAEVPVDIPPGGLLDLDGVDVVPSDGGRLALTVSVEDIAGTRIAENSYEFDVLERAEAAL